METEKQEGKKSMLNRLREAVLPIKDGDNAVVKVGKNLGFGLFLILFSCVSGAIIMAVSLAL